MFRTWRFGTLLLAALGLAPGAAHVLELPPKMGYDAQMYAAVTSTLYPLFGSVGAVIQVSAVLAAAVLTFLVRKRAVFRMTLLGTLGLVLSLVLWAALVAPVNAQWLQVIQTSPDAVAAAYSRRRTPGCVLGGSTGTSQRSPPGSPGSACCCRPPSPTSVRRAGEIGRHQLRRASSSCSGLSLHGLT